MQELLKKIEADAAARLPAPEGQPAGVDLDRCKTFLKLETHRLKLQHRAGGGGLLLCQARAHVLDALLRHLWDTARAALSEAERRELGTTALVAIGGYGRGELNPHSDIDFMFLHGRQLVGNRPLPSLSKVMDGILYPLWDLGLKVGHSVRSVADSVGVANADMQAKTALIESRLLTGDPELFARFQKALDRKAVAGHVKDYIRMRLDDQAARRAKFGNSATMQEPNLKNGCGGLRDYQNLLWMARFKCGTRSLPDLQDREMISKSERKQLETAYDFLLRTRTELHYHVNRAVDVLGKNLQPAVAHSLGYHERSPSKRIERFMHDLYRHLRNIFLITRTVEQRLALIPVEPSRLSLRFLLRGRHKPPQEPIDGFKFVDGEILAVSPRVFHDHPHRLMRVFLYAQQRGLRLHPDLAQLIRNQTALVDRNFLRDEGVRETFLTILNQRGSVAPVLRAMHEVDFLGRYIPEFGKVTCLVQHEFYHQYTADEHTLVCLEQLDRVWEAKAPPYQAYADLLHKLERPSVLYLALLLHDLGKPMGHDHSAHGAEIARRVGRRLGLDGVAAHSLCLIVEQHLLLVAVSQRRDLDDPAVIRRVARLVQTNENLAMLTLHTFVDSVATSDKLWNGFKDSLLWLLFHRTTALISGGTEFVQTEAVQRELLGQEVRRLKPASISEEEIEAHMIALPPRYHVIHAAPEVLEDVSLAHQFMHRQVEAEADALAPVIAWHHEPDRGFSRVKVCTWDRVGLFSRITGSFSSAGLNILSAQVFTRADGVALDTFCVIQARDGSLAEAGQQKEFGGILHQVLTREGTDLRALIARQKISRPPYQAYLGERIATEIRFDNEVSDARTLIEIETEDRLGLLYAISEALAGLELDISAARISTERGAASDSFYVRERDGSRVLAGPRQEEIRERLRLAIQSLD